MSENISNLTVNLTVSQVRLGTRFSIFVRFWSGPRFSKFVYGLGLKKMGYHFDRHNILAIRVRHSILTKTTTERFWQKSGLH